MEGGYLPAPVDAGAPGRGCLSGLRRRAILCISGHLVLLLLRDPSPMLTLMLVTVSHLIARAPTYPSAIEMGAAFSRSKPESADQSAREQDALEEQQDGRAVEATEVPTQGQRQEQQEQQQEERHHVQQTAASVPATATDTTRQRTDVFIPADIAMILDSGLHRDPDNDEDFATAKAAAPGQSIQDAVREFKEKYRINMGMGDGSAAGAPAGDEREEGELEDVRAELEKREGSLKARLAALKQRQQQQRQQQAGSTHTANATVTHVKTTE